MPDQSDPNLSVNSWLQEELYQTYLHDKRNVDETWKDVFESNGRASAPPPPAPPPAASPNGHSSAAPAASSAPPLNATDQLEPMRGVAAKIAENMAASLAVPTATTQRLIAVSALEQARSFLNEQLAGKTKLSYTHLISWAILKALRDFPQINHAFAEQDGQPFRVVRKEVNFGLAVDVKAKDGSSTLMVPNIKNAGVLSFQDFLGAFDDVVTRARNGKLQLPDFQGTTISLTNPGTVGTFGSVPRLVAGQGAIIATGAMEYPPEFTTVPPAKRAELGISKIMMVTCTYDHRIIQGAESGRFLGRLQALLNGEDGFYEEIYQALGIAVRPGTHPLRAPGSEPAVSTADAMKEAAVAHLINAYRVRGHLIADLDPLGSKRPIHPDLEPATHGLTEADMDRPFASVAGKSLRQVVAEMKQTYCNKLTCEFMYIPDPEQKNWLRKRMESTLNSWPFSSEQRQQILENLMEAEEFERFLHTRFVGKKRFSVEGGEAAIAALDEMLDRAAEAGVKEAVIGMAHRGRLTVLANVAGKPMHQVFSEFEEAPDAPMNTYGSGDVKYHLGAQGTHTAPSGKHITVSVAFNPSHLEAVDPVVIGMVRQKQDWIGDKERDYILPILVHGDAAFAGQGVVAETLNLSQLEGYTTGGTLHLVINNQVGFTTPPEEARTGQYATDIARCIHAPIFHVNADDPEAVVRAAQIAFDFRQEFNRDVVIDCVCYRRYGHNEGDDPTFTQPLMYKAIKKQPSVAAQYTERLDREGVITMAEATQRRKAFVVKMTEAYDLMKKNAESLEVHYEPAAPLVIAPTRTAIDRQTAEQVIAGMAAVPEGFHLHPKLKPFLDKRKEALNGGAMDWAFGEAMAFGSLLLDGCSVRLSGQDSGRGTFSQRHLEFFDTEDGHKFVPMRHLTDKARFEVWDSSLSEYAVMGFEFGYSLGAPNTLVLWEAQFGDFVNGAQITVDQFLSSAEEKWGQASGLVLLLPHGYEGMGPEHSSARIERFLQLCAVDNMIVANVTTPAQYFHILRRQMKGTAGGKPVHKPLVLFTPKSLLRHPRAVSHLDDLINGQFQEVLPDTTVTAHAKRILFCSGKVYYDLVTAREDKKADHVAIVRVEQMYPFPQRAIEQVLQQYGANAEVYWVQEEPRNMGPWRYMHEFLQPLIGKRTLLYAGRPESASPAPGSSKRDDYERNELLANAFADSHTTPKPKRPRVVRRGAKTK